MTVGMKLHCCYMLSTDLHCCPAVYSLWIFQTGRTFSSANFHPHATSTQTMMKVRFDGVGRLAFGVLCVPEQEVFIHFYS
jgi:hypothetical protein